VLALLDHNTVINVIDEVVAGTEMWNEERDGAEVTFGSEAFHARAPATGNALSSSEDRCGAGTTTLVLEAECNLWRDLILDTSLKSSEKYLGPRPYRQQYTRMYSLKLTRSGTDSQ